MASIPAPAAVESRSGERLLLWTLLVVYIFNFLDRQIVSILAEPIKRDLGLSDTQLGLMTGLAFALFYAVLGVPIARWADRPGSDRVSLIAVSLLLWSGMTALCGMAQNFVQLLLARIGVGVGEAGCTPAAHSLITDAVAPSRRASAIAFYGLGIPIGSLMGTIIGGSLADAFGWRLAFLVVGLPGAFLALFVWLALRDPRRIPAALKPLSDGTPSAPAPPPARLPLGAALRQLAQSPAYRTITLASGLVAFLSYGKGVWTLIYFQRTHGLSVGQTALWVGAILGVAGIFGTWVGGWLADRYGAANRRHMLTGPAIGMVIAPPILFAAYASNDWRVALALMIVPTICNSSYYGPAYAAVQVTATPQTRAMAAAVMVFAQNLIGLGLGPLFFGALSDWFRPMAGPDSVRWVLYGAAWLGLLPAFFFWRGSIALGREAKARA